MVVPVCLPIMFIVLMGVCKSERCHVMPSHTMLASRQVLLELWPGSGTALRGLTRRIDIIVRGSPRPTSLSASAGARPLGKPPCCGPAAAAACKRTPMGNHGAQTTPTYVATSLAARLYRVDPDDQLYRNSSWYRPAARVSAMERHGARREDVE
jgi:hypothetical protein